MCGNLRGDNEWRYVYTQFIPQANRAQIRLVALEYAYGNVWWDRISLVKDTLPPRVLVLSPQEGERFMVNDTLHLSWHTHDDGTIDHFEVYYSCLLYTSPSPRD